MVSRRLGDLAETISTGMPRSYEAADDGDRSVLLVNVGDLVDGAVATPEQTVPYGNGKRLSQYQVRAGDVLVAGRGTQPKVALVPDGFGDAVISSNLIMVRLAGQLKPQVLAAYLMSPEGQVQLAVRAGASAGYLALTARALGDLAVPVPPLETQERLARLFDASERHYKMAVSSAEQRRAAALGLIVGEFAQHTPNAKGDR